MVASPHKRCDPLVEGLTSRLVSHRLVRISGDEELNSEHLAEVKPDWIFFPHWSWVIPKEIHGQYKCVIFHMTDLPYGRGGSPLQNLIVRGHKDTMLSALQCGAKFDAGPVYKKVPLSLDGSAEEILQRATSLMEDMIVDIVESDPIPVSQSGDVSIFKRRSPQEGDVSTLETLEQVYDYIRMLDAENYPKAFIRTPYLSFEFSQAKSDTDSVEARVRIRRRDEK